MVPEERGKENPVSERKKQGRKVLPPDSKKREKKEEGKNE